MPGKFTDKNGGNMAGHSDKWSDENRRKNSFQAGQGSRGSRNQGTGEAGKANTVASQGIDTSNMSQHEKLKYFNSLGLLNPQQKQQLAALDKAQEQPKAAPEAPEQPKAVNPVKELSDKLGKIFANKPQLIQGIVKALQAVPKEQLKDKAQAVLDSMKGNSSNNPVEVFSTIMRALEGKPQADDDIEFDEPAQEVENLDSIVSTFGKIGAEDKTNAQQVKNVQAKLQNRLEGKDEKIKLAADALKKALESYKPGEKSRFITAMNAVFGAMKKYEAEHGEKVTPDGYLLRKDEEGAVDQKNAEPDYSDLPDTVDMDGYIHRPDMQEFGSDKEGFEHAMAVYKALVDNPQYANSFVDEFDSAWNNYQDKGYDFPAEAAFFELGKLLAKNGINVGSNGEANTSEMDAELAKDRKMTDKSIHELQKLMMWIAEIGKKAGADPKSINSNISWIKHKVDNNARKLQKAWTDLVNGADDVDIDSPEAYEYALNTLDNSFHDYENGNVTDWEKDIMHKYGK